MHKLLLSNQFRKREKKKIPVKEAAVYNENDVNNNVCEFVREFGAPRTVSSRQIYRIDNLHFGTYSVKRRLCDIKRR